MIVNNLNVGPAIVGPNKADPILLVDPNAVLAGSVALQQFELIIWRATKVGEAYGSIQLIKLPPSHVPNRPRTGSPRFARVVSLKNVFGSIIREGNNTHKSIPLPAGENYEVPEL